MESKSCFNILCRGTTTPEWKKGWLAKSGKYVNLCYDCGSAYERSVYCEKFHLEEDGWRECVVCRKRIHCGCKASMHMHEALDIGGVGCAKCAKDARLHMIPSFQTFKEIDTSTVDSVTGLRSTSTGNGVASNNDNDGKFGFLSTIVEVDESCMVSESQRGNVGSSRGKIETEVKEGKVGKGYLKITKLSKLPSRRGESKNKIPGIMISDRREAVGQPSLSTGLETQSRVPSYEVASVDPGKDSKTSSASQKSVDLQPRIASPPPGGEGKSHLLLPRYRPRIADQELKKLSGDLKSTITPLFEKVLSASDVGRIGRLIIPKACAEECFPHISQSDGIPMKAQDAQGKDWTFQFRFWPNNNSRMYVLEGVTPCLKSMRLQAGDTVTFSRIDPAGKLVLGFRKAPNFSGMQDSEASATPSESEDRHSEALSSRMHSGDGNISRQRRDGEVCEDTGNELEIHQRLGNLEKKMAKNVGPKSKRLSINNEDALEARLTLEEAQELLRPPHEPRIVAVENVIFEEYDEAPVLGKKTIFSALPSRGQEQWAQCDSCSKWRKIPIHVLLGPEEWTCSDNIWDSSRASCSAPSELNHKELDQLLRLSRDFKKKKTIDNHKRVQENQYSGLEVLASIAALGDSVADAGEPSAGLTSKHPRHRQGCSCIVCSQPPSGQSKRDSIRTSSVGMTVKRRCRTLNDRKKGKKQRPSEHEATTTNAQANSDDNNAKLEMNRAGGPREVELEVVEDRNVDNVEKEATGARGEAQAEPEADLVVVEDHDDEKDETEMNRERGEARAEPEADLVVVGDHDDDKDETEINGERRVAQREPEVEVIVVEDSDDSKNERNMNGAGEATLNPSRNQIRIEPCGGPIHIDLNCEPELDDMEMEWSFQGDEAGPSSSNWEHGNGSNYGNRLG